MDEGAPGEETDTADGALTVLGVRVDLERLAYSTVVLMSVLVVFDWAVVTTFVGIAVVIAAPTLAMVVAHFFADVLYRQAELRRLLLGREWCELVRRQSDTALAAGPPLLILLVGWISPADALGTVTVLLSTGLVTLVALASISAYRAGLRGWRLAASGALGGAIGLLVISLQIVLKPHA